MFYVDKVLLERFKILHRRFNRKYIEGNNIVQQTISPRAIQTFQSLGQSLVRNDEDDHR